jgi:hypothetical protein
VSLAGRLEEVELAELLHFLSLNNRTGKISLTRRDGHGLVVVRLGRIVYAASSSIRETFGNILICRGLVAPETLAVALERQHAAGDDRKLGHILVEMGSLTEQQLQEVIRQQTGLVVQELCRWRSGYFRFEVAPVASRGEIGVDAEDLVVPGGVATDQILLEAMTALDEEDPTPGPVDARALATAALSPVLRAETTVDLLRQAAAVARRGLLLIVRGDEVRGAGQFGLDPSAVPDDLAHSIHLSLSEPTVVTDAVERRETWRGEVPATPPNDAFLGTLGDTRPGEAVVVPMLLRDGVGLVVYGDDAGSGQPLGPVGELEWSLLEAGLSMERDLLEDRMRAFEKARGYRP